MSNRAGMAAVILAAGKGTRMKSELPKVLHEVCGKPLLHYPLEQARAIRCNPLVVVIGHGAGEVESRFAAPDISFALQAEQLGTGHALKMAAPALAGFEGDILLACGDTPLLTREVLEGLRVAHQEAGAAVSVLSCTVSDPTGYGRIVRDSAGNCTGIVEQKDASPEQRAIREINSGVYLFQAPFVFDALQNLSTDNAQGEYYLTDVLAIAVERGLKVQALPLAREEEILGVNDRLQLAEAGRIMRRRINDRHMLNGVTLVDPDATYIDAGVVIGADTVIAPQVYLRGATVVGSGCTIEPGAMLTDARIADNVTIRNNSVIQEAEVGPKSVIGPMAHLRPGTVLAGDNKIGNFVETKKATLGIKSQASHLTYIGDATVGERVNFGCGTITCNYDGVNKFQTTIGDDVFVGSDTQFIAPVTIGSNSLIGAGSTITKDVPADALALSRSEQKIIAGWALRKKKKKD